MRPAKAVGQYDQRDRALRLWKLQDAVNIAILPGIMISFILPSAAVAVGISACI